MFKVIKTKYQCLPKSQFSQLSFIMLKPTRGLMEGPLIIVISKEGFFIIMGVVFTVSIQSRQSLTLTKGTHIFNMHCRGYWTILQKSLAVISMIPYGDY